jgi:integrase
MRKPFHWKERSGWYLRIPTADGKLQTIRLGDTRKAAYDAWDLMKVCAKQSDTHGDQTPVVSLISQYIASIRDDAKMGRIATKTVTRRIDHIAPFLAACESLSIGELKPHHVTDWLRGQNRWNATTRSDAAAAIKRAIQWAVDEGRIPTNPIGKLTLQRGRARDHLVSRPEFETLLAGVWKQNYARRYVTSFRAVLLALRLSGCRPSEIINATIEDFDGSTWTIREHKNDKKSHRPRVVYLSPCLQTLTKIAARGRESGPIFLAAEGRPWKYSDLRKRFERLRDKTGISSKCVLYSFRHTWITDALIAGVDVATVAEMAGTSIEMIDRHYGHLNQAKNHMIKAAAVVASARTTKAG